MKPVFEKPKIFISHGRAGESLNVFRSFLESLNFEVIVVVDEPSSGMALSQKVKSFIKESDCILVLATPDNKDEVSDAYQPRANVSHEIGFAEALSKPIIYLKHNEVTFGTNYSDKVWISFSSQDYHTAYKQIIDEAKKLNLLSIVGKINKESIKSEIVEKTLRLVDILNINDSDIKSNILYNLGLALYRKSNELTEVETREFFDFYPEYTQTCAYDGYKNENLYGAIRLLSFSLQISPVSSRKADYIAMLCDALYVGEGMLDEDIKKEINTLLIEEVRDCSLFNDERHVRKIDFYLEILNDVNRKLFWGHASHTEEINSELVDKLKWFLFAIYSGNGVDPKLFGKIEGFPVFLGASQPAPTESERFRFKTALEEKTENAEGNEKRLMFRFLAKHFREEDIEGCLAVIRHGDEDTTSRILWILGEALVSLTPLLTAAFLDIFRGKNHKLIGVLATVLGKIQTNKFNDQLIEALADFDFKSRRRIVWAMGKIQSLEFVEVLGGLEVEENNYALKEEVEKTLSVLALKNNSITKA
jgi:hypothetical protein